MQVFIWANVKAAARRQIVASVPDAVFADRSQSDDDNRTAFVQAEVAFGDAPARWLPETRALRWMQLESVGFGQYAGWVQPGQTITNMHGFGKEVVTETAVAGILALYRRLNTLAQLQAAHAWQMTMIRSEAKMLSGAQVIILGAGSIGGYLRAALEAFGCTVMQFARQSPVELRSLDALDAHLPEADLVIGCLPHTPQTAGLMDAERLAKLRPDAILVNVGRGSLVDETALVAALHSGRLGGAVLDVTAVEPLPPDSPLWTCPNTILTQHTAGGYADESSDKTRRFLDNLERYRSGQPLLNVVDFERGY